MGVKCSMSPHTHIHSLTPVEDCREPKHQEDERKKRPKYRLASSFELTDEQPTVTRPRACSVPRHGYTLNTNSHEHLFGQPTPAMVRRLRRIEQGREETRTVQSKKPLPVNPLTGEVLGRPQLPHSEIQLNKVSASRLLNGSMVRTKSIGTALHTRLW